MPEWQREKAGRGGPGWVFPAALLLISVVGSLALYRLGPDWVRASFHPVRLDTLDGWAGCWVALVVAVVWHEMGHLAVAWALGFAVTGFAVGPFRASKAGGKWSLQISWRRFWQGSVISIPRGRQGWRWKTFAVVLAGPLATGGAAVLFLSMLQLRWFRPEEVFVQAGAQINTLLFLLQFMPTPVGARKANDMRLLIACVQFDWQARAILLYQSVLWANLEGRRPREYPSWLVTQLAGARARPEMSAVFALSIADWALDCGDWESAGAWNRRAGELVAISPPEDCYLVLAHSACLDVVIDRNLKAAACKVARLPEKLLRSKPLRFRSRGIAELGCGDYKNAFANFERARFYQPAEHVPAIAYERMLLNALSEFTGEQLRSNRRYAR